ncbi:MAG: transglutaminase domain-containing protein [Candidatus Omnitrophota bacterium]
MRRQKKIYEFCAKDIRYVAVEYGESGYEPHYANDVFLNRYGDCKDKATLLVAMLREAGLKAYPVLIPTRSVYAIHDDFPAVNFNHAIAVLLHDEKLVFMDATTQTTAFGDIPLDDQETDVLVLFDDGPRIERTPLLRNNKIIYDTVINIDEDENGKINRTVTTYGNYAAYYRHYLKNTHPNLIKENIQARMVEISPHSWLIDYAFTDPDDFDKIPELRYKFEARKILNPAGNLRILPAISDIDIDTAYASKESRNFPVDFNGIFNKISKITVNLPGNIKIAHLPKNKEVNTKWFKYTLRYDNDDDNVKIHREFSVNERFVEKDDYPEFKNSLEKVFYLLRERVILEKVDK